MFYFRSVLVTLWLFCVSVIGTLYSILNWGKLDTDRDCARIFSWGALKILGIKVEIEGQEYLESTEPRIYVANHQSNLDVATFGVMYPRRTVVIGKKELQWVPFFGLFFIAAGNITIDRKKTAKAVAGLSKAVEAIRNRKASIWIFPEGTRNHSETGLLPFKRGAFHMALQAGVPIVPVVSEPLHYLVSWREKKMRKGVLKIKVLPPIETTGMQLDQVEELSSRVRAAMLEALHGLDSIKSKVYSRDSLLIPRP